jgi:NAD-dependent dihydropyrimidine dehydrogenase PreA subunit
VVVPQPLVRNSGLPVSGSKRICTLAWGMTKRSQIALWGGCTCGRSTSLFQTSPSDQTIVPLYGTDDVCITCKICGSVCGDQCIYVPKSKHPMNERTWKCLGLLLKGGVYLVHRF